MPHLNPTQASELLTNLPENLQSEIAMRMASLEQINPEVVKRISNVLEHKIEALGGGQVEEYGGVRAVAEMFNRMDRSAGRTVLEKIEVINSDLANAIRDLMFVFDDILLLNDQAVIEILKRADKKTLALALKGTNEQLQQMFFRNMSQRAVEMMNEEMEYMGLVRVARRQACAERGGRNRSSARGGGRDLHRRLGRRGIRCLNAR